MNLEKNMENFKENFSTNLKALMQVNNIGQTELSERIGKSRGTVINWLNGRTLPDVQDAIGLSDVFGNTVDELIRDLGADVQELSVGEASPKYNSMVLSHLKFGKIDLAIVKDDNNSPLLAAEDLINVENVPIDKIKPDELVRIIIDDHVVIGRFSIVDGSIIVQPTRSDAKPIDLSKMDVKLIKVYRIKAIYSRRVLSA